MTDTTAVPTLGVAELTRQIEEARDRRRQLREEHRRQDEALERKIEELTERRRVANAGVTAEEQRVAEAIIYVHGSTLESAEGAFEAAVKSLANGAESMGRDAIGAKRYDRFHQRCDCEYGYGPAHGSIVFQVGLQQERRKQPLPLTEEERDVCVRYLLARRRVDEEKAAEARRSRGYW